MSSKGLRNIPEPERRQVAERRSVSCHGLARLGANDYIKKVSKQCK